jgi:hypothetical protein
MVSMIKKGMEPCGRRRPIKITKRQVFIFFN